MLISVQDRCTVCAECTTGKEIVLVVPDGTIGDVGKGRLISVCLEIAVISMQDRFTVCTELAIGSEISWDEPDGTPR